MRKTAALLLFTGTAFAAAQPLAQSELEQVGLTPPTLLSQGYQATGEEAMVTQLIGASLYGGTDQDARIVGSIADLIIGADGDVLAAVVRLGNGGRQVAVDYAQIQRVATLDGTLRLALDIAPEALAEAPDFTPPQSGPAPDASPAPPPMSFEVAPAASNDFAQPDPGLLDGLPVYGQNDQPIGFIGSVLTHEDGDIDALVVDVGGFLGLGAKPVALAYESVTLAQSADGSLFVSIATTRQALESQPAYDPDTYAAERDNQRLVL